jgi:DNA polymerase I-like protein with 3'-5' exonuclease and polymerase domains
VTTLYGRRARFDNDAFTHAAINYVIQGSAADIMKAKLVELHKERKWTGFVMRQTVHDEVDGDATTPETADRVNEILNRQTFDTKVPIVWQTRTGANWSEC